MCVVCLVTVPHNTYVSVKSIRMSGSVLVDLCDLIDRHLLCNKRNPIN